MPILSIIWSVLSSRLGGWIMGGLAVLAILGVLKWEHEAKLKAQAQLATAQTSGRNLPAAGSPLPGTGRDKGQGH